MGGKERMLEIPIDPSKMSGSLNDYDWVNKKSGGNVITSNFSFDSKCFVVFRELARQISTFTAWDKKARIVLEYDPQQEKMTVVTIMEHDEAIQMEPFREWSKDLARQ